jgi:Flp pilus assembly pilin Flp
VRALLRRFRSGAAGVVAIETALIMAALAAALLVVVPELVNHTRGKSLLSRTTAATADILGSLSEEMGVAEFNSAVSMANWSLEPLPSTFLAFRAQSFVREGDTVAQQWERTSGSACEPATADVADAEALLPVEGRSLIVVSSCYVLPSLTGITEPLTLTSRVWQVARVGLVQAPNSSGS